jgi:hypothetical protein
VATAKTSEQDAASIFSSRMNKEERAKISVVTRAECRAISFWQGTDCVPHPLRFPATSRLRLLSFMDLIIRAQVKEIEGVLNELKSQLSIRELSQFVNRDGGYETYMKRPLHLAVARCLTHAEVRARGSNTLSSQITPIILSSSAACMAATTQPVMERILPPPVSPVSPASTTQPVMERTLTPPVSPSSPASVSSASPPNVSLPLFASTTAAITLQYSSAAIAMRDDESKYGTACVFIIAERQIKLQIVDLLLRCGARLDLCDYYFANILQAAALNQSIHYRAFGDGMLVDIKSLVDKQVTPRIHKFDEAMAYMKSMDLPPMN